MKRFLTICAAILAIAIAVQVGRIVNSSGMLTSIEPHFEGTCTSITGVTGAEDITIDHQARYAYISANDRRAAATGRSVQGGIYGLDLTNSSAKPILLSGDYADSFHPHGISLYKGKDGKDRLFVINHVEQGLSQVDLFEIEGPGRLAHRTSIRYAQMVAPNDLVAVGPDRFYATNDHGNPPGFMQALEDYLTIPLSNVTYFDGQEGRVFQLCPGQLASIDGLTDRGPGILVQPGINDDVAVDGQQVGDPLRFVGQRLSDEPRGRLTVL